MCSAQQAGTSSAELKDRKRRDRRKHRLRSGHPDEESPYYLLAAAMVATTFFQQRQMQRASPPGEPAAADADPRDALLFGFWGFFFPAGLVLYWTTAT
jgi:hypothetical protein